MTFLQTRFIEDLRDIHDGEEIWIIGTGKSLDDFPDDFFDNKISVALNWAILRFPRCNYWHGHHEVFREYLRDKKPEFLEKSIILYPFPGPYAHGRITDPKEFFGDLTSLPIWMRFYDGPKSKTVLEESVKGIIEKKDNVHYRACMTVAHTAIEAAAIMGAKKITLAGCEHKILGGGKGYGEKDGISKVYGSYRVNGCVILGTQWLAELFGKYGIEMALVHE